MKNILKCPNCSSLLYKDNNCFKCDNRHSFDIAKKGYVNLLLANQHHNDNSGDSKFMMEARERFLSSDKYSILKDELINIISSYYHDDFVFGDMACGEGYYTIKIHEALKRLGNTSTYGIDLSREAINECSKKQRINNQKDDSLYIIGNLSYLPFLDNSFDLLLNCFAKLEEKEFLRVLKKDGIFIRVLPGKRHLFALKEIVYSNPYENQDKDLNIDGLFLIDTREISTMIDLNNQEIKDVFTMTPYYYKSPQDGVKKLYDTPSLTTEISFKLLVYKKN